MPVESINHINRTGMDVGAIIRHPGHVLARGRQAEKEEYYKAKSKGAERAVEQPTQLHFFLHKTPRDFQERFPSLLVPSPWRASATPPGRMMLVAMNAPAAIILRWSMK